MCANFTIEATEDELSSYFNVPQDQTVLPERGELFPKYDAPIVLEEASHARVMRLARWGLIPFWAKTEGDQPQPSNAQGETAAQKPMFKKLLQSKRCLLPANRFFEWKTVEGKKDRHFISLPGRKLFAFAGLWDTWRGEKAVTSCTMLTTAPNEFMSEIHNRMPVILHREDFDAWLSPKTPLASVEGLLRPWDGELQAVPAPSAPRAKKPSESKTKNGLKQEAGLFGD